MDGAFGVLSDNSALSRLPAAMVQRACLFDSFRDMLATVNPGVPSGGPPRMASSSRMRMNNVSVMAEEEEIPWLNSLTYSQS